MEPSQGWQISQTFQPSHFDGSVPLRTRRVCALCPTKKNLVSNLARLGTSVKNSPIVMKLGSLEALVMWSIMAFTFLLYNF